MCINRDLPIYCTNDPADLGCRGGFSEVLGLPEDSPLGRHLHVRCTTPRPPAPSRKLRRLFAAAVGLGALVLAATALSRSRPARDRTIQLIGSSQKQDGKVQVVHVKARSPEARTKVSKLGLDMTEHGDATGVEVVLHGTKDAARLREAGFDYNVKIADLAAQEQDERCEGPEVRRGRRAVAAAERAYVVPAPR